VVPKLYGVRLASNGRLMVCHFVSYCAFVYACVCQGRWSLYLGKEHVFPAF